MVFLQSVSPGTVSTDPSDVHSSSIKDSIEIEERLTPADVADAVIYVLSTRANVQIHDVVLRPLGEPF